MAIDISDIKDVGVIMGSKTMWVFEDMVEKYAGAKILYEEIKKECLCKDPHCSRKRLQAELKEICDGNVDFCEEYLVLLENPELNKDKFKEFFNRCQERKRSMRIINPYDVTLGQR